MVKTSENGLKRDLKTVEVLLNRAECILVNRMHTTNSDKLSDDMKSVYRNIMSSISKINNINSA